MENKREKSIDLLKAILVLLMILAHTFQLIMRTDITPIDKNNRLMIYINLISFSGFLFCFGYSTYIAYLCKDKKEIKLKLVKNIIRLLFAFYISGVSYYIIVMKGLNIFKISEIFLLLYIPNFSEFLASFMILNLFILIFFDYLKKILENKKIFITCIIISLILTFIPYSFMKHSWLSLIIGKNGICFPILQYMSLFLFGMYFAKYKPRFRISTMLFILIAFIIFEIGVSNNWNLVGRFPPKILWIVGSYFFVYMLYYSSVYICKRYEESNFLSFILFIGRNTLIFLITSNLILFIFHRYIPYREVNIFLTINIYIFVTGMCYICSKMKITYLNRVK